MGSQTDHAGGAPGRGEKVRVAVLGAARDELRESGYAALSVENVARRAGVHKTTVYRRWADRESLIVDALSDEIGRQIPVPDTGSFEGDLRQLADSFARWAASASGEAVLAALLSDAVRIPELAEARSRIFQERLRRAGPVVVRAMERGEIPSGTDPGQVVRTLVAPLYLRLLITGEPLDDGATDQAVRVTIAATSAGVLER